MNSDDVDFSYNLVYLSSKDDSGELDNVLVMNGTSAVFEAEDLVSGECYEISVVAVGDNGVEGISLEDEACTLEEKKRVKSSKKKVVEDVTPYFYIGDDEVSEDVEIVLGNSVVEDKGRDVLVLFCWVLGLLIFVLLVSIFILVLRR